MKILKRLTVLTLVVFATGQIYSQNTDTEVEKEAVLNVMKSYKNAFEKLTTEGT